MIELVNTHGEVVDTRPQPEPGSVLLTDGCFGVAWQRHFSDRRWHSSTGAVRTYSSLMRHRNVLLVHDAGVRDE